MTDRIPSNRGLLLTGLDGSNPLAFLAAIGTLRTLTIAMPDDHVAMAWADVSGAWRPTVIASSPLDEQECLRILNNQLVEMDGHMALSVADNLNVTPQEFRAYAQACAVSAHESGDRRGRISADFAAAFSCDAIVNEQGKVQDTALRTMSGAGHQHFLAFMRHIVKQATVEHLHKALFSVWKYDDPVTNQTLRWDPADDSRYALQWRDPSGDPGRKKGGTMLGANRLAMEGLPLVTCVPVGSHLRTVGFKGRGARDTSWTWPIWSSPVSLDVCRSLLSLQELVDDSGEARRRLRAYGVKAAFRSKRITIGKFRNFTPAITVA